MGDGAGAVVMQMRIVVRENVAAGEALFQVLEEGGVDGHYVLEVAVNRAILDHQDFAVTLDDLGLDLAHFFVHQDRKRFLAAHDLLAGLGDAARAQRVGLARPAQRGLGLLIRLQQRLFGPTGNERRVLLDLIGFIENGPGGLGRVGQGFFHVLDRLVHSFELLFVGCRLPPCTHRFKINALTRHSLAARSIFPV